MKSLLKTFLNKNFFFAIVLFVITFSCFYFKEPGYNPLSILYIFFYGFFFCFAYFYLIKKNYAIILIAFLIFILIFGLLDGNVFRYLNVIVVHFLPICVYIFFRKFCTKGFVISFFHILYCFAILNCFFLFLSQLGMNPITVTERQQLSGLFPNPNMLGVFLLFSFIMWLNVNEKLFILKNKLFLFNLILFGSSIWFTGSRRSILFFIFYLSYIFFKSQKNKTIYFILIFLIIFCGFYYFKIFDLVINFYYLIINLEITDLSLSMRFDRVTEVITSISNNLLTLLFGTWGQYGDIGNYFTETYSLGALDVYPILLLSDLGLFGLIIISAIYIYILRSNNSDNEFTKLNKKVVLWVILLTSLFGNTIITFPIILILPLLISHLSIKYT